MEVYLPPFKAALDAGAATFMNSFNDLNGIPATGNKYLQREILKRKWGFKGFVVSDWGSIGEMINHGNVKNEYEAALSAITQQEVIWIWKVAVIKIIWRSY
jgi:beta-glucosidase